MPFVTTIPFETLKGKTIVKVEGLEKYNDTVSFFTSDGNEYMMFHEDECCESVCIEDVCGDIEDLIGSEILIAECVESNDGKYPPSEELDPVPESYTWTFYKLATRKGYVDIRWRWYGMSNGYYSESVEFIDANKPYGE